MTFYLKPPQGVLPLHTLQTCVRERFEYLKLILRDEGETYIPTNFEYLIEGSAMDRAGHFLLRLLSLRSSQFQDFLLAAETKLFLHRLNLCRCSQEVRAFLKLIHRHADECLTSQSYLLKNCQTFLTTAKFVCEQMMPRPVAAHTFHNKHDELCTEFSISLPFTMCLPMVRERQVDLQAGKALIPCGKWKQLLAIFFKEHIVIGMAQLQTTDAFDTAICDPRIKELIKEFDYYFKSIKTSSAGYQLQASEVEHESSHFPPCMAHLYRSLRIRHRLSHEARRYFTLFLKDIGMSVDESIHFWSEEYTRPPGCKGCNHSWQKDSKRYIYSIRHMYGLEGGRYNYSAPSCKKIQGMSLTSMSEGGCPFTSFDDAQLKSCFPARLQSNETVCHKILSLRTSEKPQEACSLYMTSCYQTLPVNHVNHVLPRIINERELEHFFSPTQYYSLTKLKR